MFSSQDLAAAFDSVDLGDEAVAPEDEDAGVTEQRGSNNQREAAESAARQQVAVASAASGRSGGGAESKFSGGGGGGSASATRSVTETKKAEPKEPSPLSKQVLRRNTHASRGPDPPSSTTTTTATTCFAKTRAGESPLPS